MEENQLKQLEECKSYVLSTSKWLKFFGIVMIISIIFMIYGGITLMTGSSFLTKTLNDSSTSFTSIIGAVYLVFAVVIIIPTVYVMRASNAGKAAALCNDNAQMVQFLKNSKSYWKFLGVLTIVSCVISLIFCIFVVIAAITTL